jgi:hypothetical protein
MLAVNVHSKDQVGIKKIQSFLMYYLMTQTILIVLSVIFYKILSDRLY